MITPEEQKQFKRLRAISKTARLGNFEWEWSDLDYKEERFLEPSIEHFISDDSYRFDYTYIDTGKGYKVPLYIANAIRSYYLREVAPKIINIFDDAMQNTEEEISQSELKFAFDIKNKQINSWIDLTYYSSEDGDGGYWEGDKDAQVMGLLNTLREISPNPSTVIIGFDGGGDSGSLSDEMIIFEEGGQTNHNIPDPIASWCYDQLPGGWEIDEGSHGEFVFNLIDNDITLNLAYGTQEEITEWIVQETFE